MNRTSCPSWPRSENFSSAARETVPPLRGTRRLAQPAKPAAATIQGTPATASTIEIAGTVSGRAVSVSAVPKTKTAVSAAIEPAVLDVPRVAFDTVLPSTSL